ncbi:AraC family transcriptional regulator [Pseudomonas chlororaphis]|uniref:AraC family transcriptional regulator n=1 Tax=Pseudomonas chlororaphis TaxID=587753 RepID=UPI0021DFB4FF|nr:AraC family transcriptional regulator [Pseudomonas chlororaphis]
MAVADGGGDAEGSAQPFDRQHHHAVADHRPDVYLGRAPLAGPCPARDQRLDRRPARPADRPGTGAVARRAGRGVERRAPGRPGQPVALQPGATFHPPGGPVADALPDALAHATGRSAPADLQPAHFADRQQLGYESEAAFSRAFRREFGVAPSEYRSQA